VPDKFPALVVKAGKKPFRLSRIKPHWLRADYGALRRHMRLRTSELDDAVITKHGIEVGFFDHLQFNAFAWTGERDLIALSGVVPITLMRIFNYLLAHPDVLPWIGSPQAGEQEFKKHEVLKLNHFMDFTNLSNDPVIKDSERFRASRWLYERAIDFIVYHELGHIWNGHTRYLKSAYGFASIDELSLTDGVGPVQLDRQTLEMDADGFAVYELLRRNYESDKWCDANLEEMTFKGSTPVVLALLAPYVVFRLFHDMSSLEEAQKFVHPPAPLRMRMMIGYAANLIHGGKMWPTESLDHAYKTAMIAGNWGEKIFDVFQEDTKGRAAAVLAFGLEASAYKRMLLANWHVVRPKLDVLKLGGTLAGSEL
jgi:hypothetical protein